MYMLPLSVLLQNLGLTPEQFRESRQVTVPTALLKLLLQAALQQTDLDETGYLQANPDVADAVKRGRLKSPTLHYQTTGYFECRLGGWPAVDERWYLKTYPDVANAVRLRKTASAAAHFAERGASEFRAPSPSSVLDAVNWGAIFGKNGSLPEQ